MTRNGLILMVLGTVAIYLNTYALAFMGHDPLLALSGIIPLAAGLFREVL